MFDKENLKKEVVQLDPQDTLRTALNAFKSFKISHLPVVKNKKLMGIVTKTSITEFIYECSSDRDSQDLSCFLDENIAANFMEKPVVTAGLDDDLWDMVSRMEQEGVGSMVIKDKDGIVGILTERDFLKVIRNSLDNVPNRAGIILDRIKDYLYGSDSYGKSNKLYGEINFS